MHGQRFTGAAVICLLSLVCAVPRAVAAEDGAVAPERSAPLFRVFLKDGTSLVSYGEFARVADRVVFSMPTAASASDPQLHLVDIPEARVDWDRTTSYLDAARAARYVATRAETDYARISAEIEIALNEATAENDPGRSLSMVEQARRKLAEWPASHYGYKHADVRQMLALMDEAILDLRAAAGVRQFDIQLSTTNIPAPRSYVSLLPPPNVKETIEHTLAAASLTESSAERTSLLSIALGSLERDRAELPESWATALTVATSAAIARELETDRAYQSLTQRMVNVASARARVADVKGIAALAADVRRRDETMGRARPDVVAGILAAIDAQLDSARRLKLARDRWALRVPELRAYRTSIGRSLQRLDEITPDLEDIRAMSGSAPEALSAIQRAAGQVQRSTVVLVPPDEMRDVHGLILSAVQLADSAARIRREAAIAGNIARAWDASSAAAGALMLVSRALADLKTALEIPQLIQ